MRARDWISCVITVLALAGSAGVAQADNMRIVSGGPQGKAERGRLVRSLAAVSRSLDVCWRGDRPDEVMVELVIEASGRMASATQKTPGPAGQCAAGVMAVQAVEPVGGRTRVTVVFDTSAGAAGSIQEALERYRDPLRACHAKAKGPSRLGLRFQIHPDGHIEQASVQSRSRDARVERCLIDTIQGAKLGAGITAKPVWYSLTLDMTPASSGGGAAAADAAAPQPAPGGQLQPRKDGPMAGPDISTVMEQRKREFTACYQAQAKRNPALAGHVMLRFTIRADGTVSNVKVRETTLNHPTVEGCIIKVGQSLRFPAQPGRSPTKVWYPFVFARK